MTDASSGTQPEEAAFLQQAIALAVENGLAGQPPFGALVVRDGHVLATGVNVTVRDHDPTAHAEVDAIRNAGDDPRLVGATLVTSCEPCALCHAAAVTAGIVRVVYAAPKELAIEILDGPEHPQGELLAAMQGALRALAPDQLVHIPTEAARDPFVRFMSRPPQP